MRRQLLLSTALCALAGAAFEPAPADAQEYATARRSFVFFGRELAIEVTADGPGALQVVRGEPGRIEVGAHAADGLSGVALGGWRGDRLRLNALGGGDASYIVVVPERVHVVATLPGQQGASRVPDEPGAVLRWEADHALAPFPEVTPSAVLSPDADGLFLVHHDDIAPAELVLHQASLNRVQVRVEGERFLVRSSQPLTLRGSQKSPLRLRTGPDPIALVVTVPSATRFFRLRSDSDILLTIHEGHASTRCDRALAVRNPAGGEQFEFVPVAGRVHCTAH